MAVLFILAIGIRIALEPSPIFHQQAAQRSPGLIGHVDDLSFQILRGRYSIKGLALDTTPTHGTQPLFAVDDITVDVSWGELMQRKIVGDVIITHPIVTIIQPAAKPAEDKKEAASPPPNWQAQVRQLLPIKVTQVAIHDGRVRYRDPNQQPKIDLHADSIEVSITNITNRDSLKDSMFTHVECQAKLQDSGKFKLDMHVDPLAKSPIFKLNTTLTDLDITKLNDVLLAYAKFDVHRGTFELFSEVAARDGAFKGYIKPVFHDLEVLNWAEEKDRDNKLQLFWKGLVGAVTNLLTNHKADQMAGKVEIEGKFSSPDISIWDATLSVLKNAFVSRSAAAAGPRYFYRRCRPQSEEITKTPSVHHQSASQSAVDRRNLPAASPTRQ